MVDILRRLQALFKRFPGIGERQAMRFAYFVATADESYVRELTETILSARKNVSRCGRCFALSEKITEGWCDICRDPAKDKTILLIVEKDADRERFVQSRTYNGTYFILGGLAPAIEKDVSSHIRTDQLVALLKKESKTGLTEVIMALSATPDGSRTEALLSERIEKELTGAISLSVLGKGLSTGTEIEYSDSETLGNALRTRTHLS